MDHRVEAANCGAAAHGWVQVATADVGGDIDPHGQREAIHLDYPTTASGLLLVLGFNMIMDPQELRSESGVTGGPVTKGAKLGAEVPPMIWKNMTPRNSTAKDTANWRENTDL